MEISNDGEVKVLDLAQSINNYHIFVSAFNGKKWSDPSEDYYLIDLTITSNPIKLPNVAPYLLGNVENQVIDITTIDSKQYEYILPQAYDPNSED